jgi:hypothetical protein
MARRYPDEYDEPSWLLKALREAAHELESQLWGLDEAELRRRPNDDAMSLIEIAAHLRDCEEYFLSTLTLVFSNDEPPIRAFDADALVLDRDYRSADLYELLEQFESLRQRSVRLLWMEDDWSRAGVHAYRGTVTAGQLVREQSEHDLEHLWQARRLRELLSEPAAVT